jgi:hypothetical protein
MASHGIARSRQSSQCHDPHFRLSRRALQACIRISLATLAAHATADRVFSKDRMIFQQNCKCTETRVGEWRDEQGMLSYRLSAQKYFETDRRKIEPIAATRFKPFSAGQVH